MWTTLNQLKSEGVEIKAITAWALFGLYGWNKLCTKPYGDYEPGVFNLSSGVARPTALARYIKELTSKQQCQHPVLQADGWWKRNDRLMYSPKTMVNINSSKAAPACQPVLIIGKTGTLGTAFSKICKDRHIHHLLLGRSELDITKKEQVKQIIKDLNPWAIINTAGYVKVDDAENDKQNCYRSNCQGPSILAEACADLPVKFLTFSTDLVFDGQKQEPYTESDPVSPLNIYGRSKADAEAKIRERNPNALIVRTSSFFGPWDEYNFATTTLKSLKEHQKVKAFKDVYMSPTYLPDLVNECLDLMLDDESGIVHLVNEGVISWAQFATKIARMAGFDPGLVQGVTSMNMRLNADRPKYSALKSEKGIKLPTVTDALERYLEALDNSYMSNRIAG
jgi:dTDP-4-dehydrorhamnose reductase